MREKAMKVLKKYGLLIWMIVAVTALASTVTFAAWTRVKRVKRVVSIQSETGMRFSSNYMSAVNPVQMRNVAMGSEDSANVEIVVRNHAQGNVSRVYPYTITYTLKATLCDSEGDPVNNYDSTFANYNIKTITKHSDSDPTYGVPVAFTAQTVEGQTNYIAEITDNSLTGGSTDEDYFLLTFDDGQKEVVTPTYYVKLEAILDEKGDDIEDLAGCVGLYAKTSRNGWSLNVADDTSKNFADFHGFNYVLSGSGEGAFKISWNPDELSLSSLFLEEIGVSISNDSENSGMKCVSFPVNSSEVNYYDVQFYKTEEFDLTSWSDMAVGGSNVKKSYVEAKSVSMSFGGETVSGNIEATAGTDVTVTATANYDYLSMITLNGNSYSLNGGSGYTVDVSSNTTTITVSGVGNITLTKSGISTNITFTSSVLETGDNSFAVKYFENGVLKIASGVIEVGTA